VSGFIQGAEKVWLGEEREKMEEGKLI